MYEAIGQEAKVPFELRELKKKVWSFDGFCYWLYHEPRTFTKVFHEKIYIDWLQNEVGMAPLAKRIRGDIGLQEDFVAVASLILSHCPYTARLNQDELGQVLDHISGMSGQERYKYWGNEAFNLGKYKEALSQYKKAQAITYTCSVANNMALVYLQWEDYEKAKKHLLKGLEVCEQPVLRLNLIRLYNILEAWQWMLEELNRLMLVFQSSEMWYYYGRAYEGLERMEEAIAAYAKALEGHEDFKALDAFVRLAEQEKASGVLKVWMSHGELSMVSRFYIGARLAKAEGNEEAYVLGLEDAGQMAATSLPYLLELSRYFREKRQIIKAIMYMEEIDVKEQNKEAVLFERSMIAKVAGNAQTYKRLVDQMTDGWKSEVRITSSR